MTMCRAQQPPPSEPSGEQVLTRGPVHEAFAGIVTFNPVPGIVITKAPPEVIEEMPPEERPEGDDVTWIPGYWAWDDERSDFLWVSGTWRDLPPGRKWIAGYWGQTPQGHQWTSGYWADAAARETTYLPPPPLTVEEGPNVVAPSADYGWTPGYWNWHQERYAWRPGYWAQGRSDWDWMPAHYVWTPRGYIFVEGYWDYSVERRGVLFAPVYFESDVYLRGGYHYSPVIVIDLDVFSDHLFLRPRYHHYYFGDYYAPSYDQGGFFASFSFQSGRHGYDPFYSRQRWQHRGERDWERRHEDSQRYRRDHENARPPRTWADQRRINTDAAESRENRMVMATSIEQLSKRKENPMRFQRVAKEERQKLADRGREVQKSREQRRMLEAISQDRPAVKAGEAAKVTREQLPPSPIVAKPAKQPGRKKQPPEIPKISNPDSDAIAQSKSNSGLKSNGSEPRPKVEESGVLSGPSKPEPVKKPKSLKPESQEKSTLKPGLEPVKKEAQTEPERRKEQAAKPTLKKTPQVAEGLNKKTIQEPEQRAKTVPVKTPGSAKQDNRKTSPITQKVTQDPNPKKTVKSEKETVPSIQKQREKAGVEKTPPTKKKDKKTDEPSDKAQVEDKKKE